MAIKELNPRGGTPFAKNRGENWIYGSCNHLSVLEISEGALGANLRRVPLVPQSRMPVCQTDISWAAISDVGFPAKSARKNSEFDDR